MKTIRILSILICAVLLWSAPAVLADLANDSELPEDSFNPGEPGVTLGDVNGDGAIDSTDARMILQYFVGSLPGFV